ncbi:hypothetical protein HAX54_013455 [Datura stramonium]|uniref:Uncharacterized protein n=1 Tax=Datura stramonium TaxID=4076 RepID=A0ABS8RYG1_DATST|nr:hypothetical protein [Datura stramonium]
MTQKLCCMVMRINIDCKGCYMKVSRALLTIPELETRFIEKNHSRVIVCGNFVPQDVAIKIRKKTNRRVEILEIQDLSGKDDERQEQMASCDHKAEAETYVVAPQNFTTTTHVLPSFPLIKNIIV